MKWLNSEIIMFAATDAAAEHSSAWQHALVTLGAVLGIIAAVVTILSRWDAAWPVVQRIGRWLDEHRQAIAKRTRLTAKERQQLRLLTQYEIAPILSVGILLNVLGLALATRFSSLLYLDMIGTALVAFALGPWLAASVAAVTSAYINYALFAGQSDPNTVVLPWVLVNVTGGWYWGIMARRQYLAEYLSSNRLSIRNHLRFMTVACLGCSLVTAVAGTAVQSALGLGEDTFALNPSVASSIDKMADETAIWFGGELLRIMSPESAARLSHLLGAFIANVVRYVPDKTLAAILAVVLLRSLFPCTIRHDAYRQLPGFVRSVAWSGPLLFILVYLPAVIAISAVLDISLLYAVAWYIPILLAAAGFAFSLVSRGKTKSDIGSDAIVEALGRATQLLDRKPSLYASVVVVPPLMFAALAFVAGAPLILIAGEQRIGGIARIAMNFFVVIFGFASIGYIVRASARQHAAVDLLGRIRSRDRAGAPLRLEEPAPHSSTPHAAGSRSDPATKNGERAS